MPTMVRPKGKAKKVAFSILGTPPNMHDDKKKKDTALDKRLVYEETQREK
jgi:hypothetical protein